IEPKSGRTRSERMSPSRFSAGMTSGSPAALMRGGEGAAMGCGSRGASGGGARRADEEGEGRVDELRLVGDVRVALGRGVHLLLEHSFVDRADRVLRPAEDLRAGPLGV